MPRLKAPITLLVCGCVTLGAKEEGMTSSALGHRHTITAVAVTPGLLATGDMKGEVLLWNTSPLAPRAQLEPPGERSRIQDLSFSLKGDLAIATDWTGEVELWSGERHLRTLRAYTGRATALAWTPEGLLVTGGGDLDPNAAEAEDAPNDEGPPLRGWVKVWANETPRLTLAHSSSSIGALAVSADGRWLAAGADEEVRVWTLPAGDLHARFSELGEITALDFGPVGLIAVGSKGLRVLSPGVAQPGPVQAVRAPAAAGLSADRVYAGGYERIMVYRLPDLSPLADLPGRLYDAAPSEAGIWLAFADRLLLLDTDGAPVLERSVRVP